MTAMMAAPTELSDARDEALQAVRARLRAFIERRVADPDVAEDLTQDVLLRLLMNDDRQIENPTAWLYRVARNAIIDHHERRWACGIGCADCTRLHDCSERDRNRRQLAQGTPADG